MPAKNKLLTFFAFFCICFAMPHVALAQNIWRPDGNWWLANDKKAKEQHILGVMDGLMLQELLVLRSFFEIEVDPEAIKKSHSKAMLSSKSLLKNINSNQILVGLDVFYSDYRNRHIFLPNAMLVVIYQINSESPEAIDILIQSFRRARD